MSHPSLHTVCAGLFIPQLLKETPVTGVLAAGITKIRVAAILPALGSAEPWERVRPLSGSNTEWRQADKQRGQSRGVRNPQAPTPH